MGEFSIQSPLRSSSASLEPHVLAAAALRARRGIELCWCHRFGLRDQLCYSVSEAPGSLCRDAPIALCPHIVPPCLASCMSPSFWVPPHNPISSCSPRRSRRRAWHLQSCKQPWPCWASQQRNRWPCGECWPASTTWELRGPVEVRGCPLLPPYPLAVRLSGGELPWGLSAPMVVSSL